MNNNNSETASLNTNTSDNLTQNMTQEKFTNNTVFERNMGFGMADDDDLQSNMNRTFIGSETESNNGGRKLDSRVLGHHSSETASVRSEYQSIRNKHELDRSSTAADVIAIIDKISNPQELVLAFESYTPKSNLLVIEDLKKSETTKIKRYKDCIYFGQFINAKRHGKGIMVYCNGRVFEGDWENDTKHGKGLEVCPNGNKYEGHFVNGKPEGVGTFIWRNGEVYEGEWKNGLKHGSGMWRGTKGESYIGEWKYGKADGYGVHTWRNGDRYEGEFKACLKHGHGTEKFANGDFYVGNYVNGKPDGYGEYYWNNGCQYKGFFKNGLRHGKGVWKKGPGQSDKYDGEWINDKKCGYGLYNWSSGNYYKGNYFDDLRHGYGEMYWIDGSIYKGNWDKGIQHGEGELTIPGKKAKTGVFQNNVFIGDNPDGDNEGKPASQGLASNNTSIHNPDEDSMVDDRKRPSSISRNAAHTPIRSVKGGFSPGVESSGKRPLDNSIQTDVSTNHINGPTSVSSNYSRLPAIIGSRQFNQHNRASSNRVSPKVPRDTSRSQDRRISQERRQKSPPPSMNQGLLTNKEIAKWNHMKDRLSLNQEKFRNLDDPEVCERIRAIINPPIWRPWHQ